MSPLSSGEDLQSRILVVDDSPEMLESLSALLAVHGYAVEEARCGNSALDKLLPAGEYDAMLLDLGMPGLDGHQVLRRIRGSDLDLKVIVVSGQASFDAVKESLTEGAYDYVRKPYVAEELLTTLRNALRSLRLERENRKVELALRESEELHRYIVNNSPDIVYVLDREGNFTFLNDRAEELLGYRREELLGRHYSEVVHEEDIQKARYVFNERRTGKRASKNIELRLKVNNEAKAVRHFDTHVLPIELNSVGMYTPDGDPRQGSFVGTYGCARDITERKRSEALINFQAYHDLLTRLPNRALFQDRLHQAIAHARRHGQALAVFYLDLDRFKLVNDSLGHAAGDKLIQVVADRILDCLRGEDTLARFGGDEFTLLLPSVREEADAAVVARKILDVLAAPILLEGQELRVSASIGIAIYPGAGETAETLLKSADIAMYHVKSHGKNGFLCYAEGMTDACSSHLALERDLYRALEEEQFELFFQPKVASDSCRITGMEALIRWRHPERGLVYPSEFIPLAETSNLIVHLGDWVFRKACEEVNRWQEEGLPELRISVNISAVQLKQEDFIDRTLATLAEFGLPGERFELEITEHGIMKNHQQVVQRLRQLSQAGMTIAIDDFGTGYSSLSYLKQFPINTLKIDRIFVQDIETETGGSCLVDAIASMAKGLKLHMVAEGVETRSQLNYLKDLGCREVQGHLFGAARSAAETLALLRSSPQGRLQTCLAV